MISRSLTLRRFTTAGVCLLAWGWSSLAAAQATVAPETVNLQAAVDGFPIRMSYYPARPDKNPNGLENAPVVLFLHGEKSKRVEWDNGSAPRGQPPIPSYLNSQGYAVLVPDLRKHGDSIIEGRADDTVRPTDYPAMVAGDLVAIKRFLFEQHMARKLNMSKLAIVASDISVPVALAFAEADWKQPPFDDSPLMSERTPRGQDVRALVMISAKSKAGTLTAPTSMRFLASPQLGIAMLFIAGDQDKVALRDTTTLHQLAAAPPKAEERVQLITVPSKDAGIPLLVKSPQTINGMLKFLEEKFAKQEIPWRDRRSRLER